MSQNAFNMPVLAKRWRCTPQIGLVIVQVLSFRVFPAYCTWHSGPNSSVQVLHVSRLPIRGLRGAEMMSQVTAILKAQSVELQEVFFDTAVF